MWNTSTLRSEHNGTLQGFVKDSVRYSIIWAGAGALVWALGAPTVLGGAAAGWMAGTVVAGAKHSLHKVMNSKTFDIGSHQASIKKAA